MSPDSPLPPPPPVRSAWPRVVLILGLALLLVGSAAWMMRSMISLPGAALSQGSVLVGEIGRQAATVGRAFREGTVRQEFFSHAAELSGTTRLQVATLKQKETFLREEAGSAAWGLIPVPKVVVQAQAPVEYSYYVDLREGWDFRSVDKKITVVPPAIAPNTPALNVSALTFYTLEGSIWRDDEPVRERLRQTLTMSLQKRARNNVALVREVARREIAAFVEKWLTEKFGDGGDYVVQVVFPDEVPVRPGATPKP